MSEKFLAPTGAKYDEARRPVMGQLEVCLTQRRKVATKDAKKIRGSLCCLCVFA